MLVHGKPLPVVNFYVQDVVVLPNCEVILAHELYMYLNFWSLYVLLKPKNGHCALLPLQQQLGTLMVIVVVTLSEENLNPGEGCVNDA